MISDLIKNIKGWFGDSEGGFNIKVSQKNLKNLSPGKVITFNNLPEIIYNSLIGKSIDLDRLQFEVKLEIRYNEDGFEYKEFKIEDDGMEYWLEVVRDLGTWSISIWKRLTDIDEAVFMKDGKVVDTIQYENQTYNRDASGSTKFDVLDKDNPVSGTIGYWRFQCVEDPKKAFSVSDWMESGQYECAVGEWVKERDFEILVFSGSFQ